VLAALLVTGLMSGGCGKGGDESKKAASDPVGRLSELLRRGAQPGELTGAEREEIEALVLAMLPPAAGPLAGHRWRVAYDDLPLGDFVSVDLLRGDDDATAARPVWVHLVWRGELSEQERGRFGKRVGDWPARGVDDHHLFVRAGSLELRAVADSPEYRDPARLRAFVESFDLDTLARL
jgi:hypothetical protein